MLNTKIAGIGHYVPSRIISNKDLELSLIHIYRDGHLKLQYAYYNHSDIHNVMEAILSYCFNKDFHTCSIYDKHISALLQKNSGIILKKKIYRKYLISNELKNQFEDNSIIEAGDGDCVFT